MNTTRCVFLFVVTAGLALADRSAIGPYGGPMMSGVSSPANGQAGYFAFDSAFHPTDPNVGWAASGSAVKTTNAGTAWNYMSMPGGTYARNVKVHPANPLLVMTAGYVYIDNTSRFGIRVSTDMGQTWQRSHTGLAGVVYSVAPSPRERGRRLRFGQAGPRRSFRGDLHCQGERREDYVQTRADSRALTALQGTESRERTGSLRRASRIAEVIAVSWPGSCRRVND